ncbi:hypothetical protein ACO30A_000134 [Klebsiella aerogenes]
MTNNQLTKEWLQQTIAELESVRDEIPFGIDTNSELELAAFKLALAAMDSEPVADDGIFRPGDAVGVFNVGCETCPDHLVAWTVKGQNLPAGNYWLYISQQPAPVVPEDVLEALQKVARIRLDLNDFDGDRRGIADCLCDAEEALIEVVNRRAAMLAAAPQEAK